MISTHILFANDDVLTQWIMSEVLTDAGFSVASACREQQVIELLDDAPEFDLLLIDANLADVSQHWHTALPGRPIIYTGADRSALRRALRFGESFLRAPFGAGLLLRTIDVALAETFLCPPAPSLACGRHHVN